MKKKKKQINLFDVVPCINEHIHTEKKGELSVIAFPRFKNAFMQRWFVPKHKSKELHIDLDIHGTAVWDLIDGKRSVQDIVDLLADHFEHQENYEYRVSTFVTQLQMNDFISYLVPKE
ncbi:MAG: PqqD family protein [Bacteroidaceae bacterium]|nr:PqqD family protein [Bacteroidaceae bacterium]